MGFDFGLGDIVSSAMSLYGTMETNRANKSIAGDQMDFQRDMANSAHQREVADLRAAGLNPILSGTGGHGAATPPGASAVMQNAIGNAVSTAMESRRQRAEVANIKKDTELKDQNFWTQRALMHLYNMQWNAQSHDQEIKFQNLREAAANADIAESAAKGAKVEGEIDESKYGAALRFLNRINPLGQGASAWRNAIRAK